MKKTTLNFNIISIDRVAETRSLINSLFFNFNILQNAGELNIIINILYDNKKRPQHTHHKSYENYMEEYSHFNFVKIDANKPIDFEKIAPEGEYNIFLPSNTLITRNISPRLLQDLRDDEILDLFKGIDRQLDNSGNFIFNASTWYKENKYYYLDKNITDQNNSRFEEPKNWIYGKLFLKNEIPLKNKKIKFLGLSPAFINTSNTEKFTDLYDFEESTEYNTYSLEIRDRLGEKIDFLDYQNLSPNKLYYSYPYKFKKQKQLSVNQLIDEVYYINLDSRVDRRNKIETSLKEYGIKAERISGIIPNKDELEYYLKNHPELESEYQINQGKGRLGCAMSHLKAISKAKENGAKSVLILEDDCTFIKNPTPVINDIFEELHNLTTCDILYLGVNPLNIPLPMISAHLSKVNYSFCLHAYIVFEHMYDRLLDFDVSQYRTIDEYTATIQREKNANCFCAIPILCYQDDGYSNIDDTHANNNKSIYCTWYNASLNISSMNGNYEMVQDSEELIEKFIQSTPKPENKLKPEIFTKQYLSTMKECTRNKEMFNNFKRNRVINEYMEHIDYTQGLQISKEIMEKYNPTTDFINKAKKNDEYGNADTKVFSPEFYDISPSTLRYLKTYLEITKLCCKNLKDKNIIEIGSGYGGLCTVISQYEEYNSYTLLDLSEVLDFSKLYLKKNNIENNKFITPEEVKNDMSYDMIISCYSISEISRDMQQLYIDKILKEARHGYIIYNGIREFFDIDIMHIDEFFSKIRKVHDAKLSGATIYW